MGVAEPVSLLHIMQEQQTTAPAPVPAPAQELVFANDEDYARHLQAIEMAEVQVPVASAEDAEDRLLAQYLQAQETSEYMDRVTSQNRTQRCGNPNEKVQLQPLEALLLPSDALPAARVHSSGWQEAQRLERQAMQKLASGNGWESHNNVPTYMRHEPLLTALRATEGACELDGVGDLTGDRLLLNKALAQELRSFDKKQRKLQSAKGKDKDKDRSRHTHSRTASS